MGTDYRVQSQRPRGEERSMAVGLDILGVMAYL